uniref:CAAX prenyl protease 2/Lysostaphin resistance protein A-like domain-containing protein n=1 Tax=Aegilops tauschii TaxID=37682 RepID=M8C4V4_AEGTA
MALLFILDDEVVKYSPHARAIRDVEDEELRTFFAGMSPWQFILVVAASSVGEELFYRAAVQGALADIFLRGTELMKDARGIVSLSGMVPPFVPFAQTFAAAITAALTGSLYYIATAPKDEIEPISCRVIISDPTYVVTPVMRSHAGRQNMKKLFSAWYQRRQMRKIYSPLLEGILAFYLGFEWIQTGNILAPMITHGIYSAVVLGHGLWKIQDHRRRLRQRVQEIRRSSDEL